ncbi:MAG: uroporphyrinogen decarboxylase, partial [Opitutales bacterium]|nr:uroporphyrinogen decarboxylase [Opitutales bacterium]
MTSRERFLAACRCAPTDRVPAWVMRQAGRYLPEYRALKEKHDFLTLVRTPELAAEVTLQPARRFAQLDAAILFSDILTIPEALGQGYSFRESGGIAMDFTLDSEEKLAALGSAEDVPARLDYMAQAMRLARAELGENRALLGFAGSPWTLAVYMVEGGSAKQFSKIKRLAAEAPALFEALMEKLANAVAASLKMQIAAGADAVQIFDSWAALCTAGEYEKLSLRWIRKIIAALPAGVPVIVFAKGMAHLAPQI